MRLLARSHVSRVSSVSSVSRVSPLAIAALAPALVIAACGGGQRPVGPSVAVPTSSASGGLATTPPPSGLPPMASMPPPGVVGSRKARRKADAALYGCGAGALPAAKDPADLIKRVGEACAGASATKLKPASTVLRGTQADADKHQEHKVKVEANRCYRVYFATDTAVKDAVVVVRDSAGDMVGESTGPALPDDGVFCFTAPDEVTLLIGIGAGKGAYAAQVWSD